MCVITHKCFSGSGNEVLCNGVSGILSQKDKYRRMRYCNPDNMSPPSTISREKPMNSRPSNRPTCSWRRALFIGILVVIVLWIICGPVLALPPPAMGGGSSWFDQGIPVYWPYHALLMSAGFILLVAGVITARFHKTRNWYKTHAILQLSGGACIIAGLFTGIYMVALSGLPHLRTTHEILGVAIGALVIITIIIGYCIKRVTTLKKSVRMSHRWLGRILIALIVINSILGIQFLYAILNR